MAGAMPSGANQFAAQQVAGRAMAEPQAPGGAVDPQIVEKGRNLIYELTDLITSDPNVMLALKDDLVGFGQTLKQFAGGGQPQGQMGPQGPPMAGGPPMGGPPPGMGGGGMPPQGGGMPPMGA